MRTLPLAWFIAEGACSEAVSVLRQEWGETIPVTLESLTRAADLGLNLDWFAAHYLPVGRGAAYFASILSLQDTEPVEVPAGHYVNLRQSAHVLWATIQESLR